MDKQQAARVVQLLTLLGIPNVDLGRLSQMLSKISLLQSDSLDASPSLTQHELLTPQEASEYLRISVNTLRRYTYAGFLRPHRIAGHLRYYRGELKAFIEGDPPSPPRSQQVRKLLGPPQNGKD